MPAADLSAATDIQELVNFELASTALAEHEDWLRRREVQTAAHTERLQLKATVLEEVAPPTATSTVASSSGPQAQQVAWKWSLRPDVWAKYTDQESANIETMWQQFRAGDRSVQGFQLRVQNKFNVKITFSEDLSSGRGTQRSDKGSREILREVEEEARAAPSRGTAAARVTGKVDEVILHFHVDGKEVVEGFKSNHNGFDVYAKAYNLCSQALQDQGFVMKLEGPRGDVKIREKELDEATWGLTLSAVGMEGGKEYDIVLSRKT